MRERSVTASGPLGAARLGLPIDLLDRTVELVALDLGDLRELSRPGQVVAIVRIPESDDAPAEARPDAAPEGG